MTRPARIALLTAIVATLALMLPAPGPASAHARYESSFPAKGEVLATSPNRVEITFTQEVQRISGTYDIAVNKDRGPSVTAGPAEIDEDDRRIMRVPLQPDLAPGRYVVNWRNVSDEDGDEAIGAFSFYVQTPPNEIDLRNDEELARIGEEDAATATPAAGATPDADTPGAETPEASATAAVTPAATVVADGADGNSDSDDSGLVIVIVTVIVVGVVAAAGAFFFVRRRGT
jgi:methionine-rich copper-binding protein CopC